jgi:hypothetical protein
MIKFVKSSCVSAMMVAAVVFAAGEAAAVSVTNRDAKAVTMTLDDDGDVSKVEVAPGATVEVCPGGCSLVLGEVSTPVGGSEKMEIVGGALKLIK